MASLDISDIDTTALEEFGYTASVPKLKDSMGNDDCFSLVEIGTYGAKGMFVETLLAAQYQYVPFLALISARSFDNSF